MQDACAPEVIAVESQPDPESVGRISIPSKVEELKLVVAGIVTCMFPPRIPVAVTTISVFVVAVGVTDSPSISDE